LGLDAAEPSTWARIPNSFVATLRERGAFGRLVGNHEFLTDTVWPEIRTGSSAARTGVYFQPSQIPTGSSRARARRADELAPAHSYWNWIAQRGLRVAAVDQPVSPPLRGGGAVEVCEWGTHDRLGFDGGPDDPVAANIVERHAPYPVWSCDQRNDGSRRAQDDLFDDLYRAVGRKSSLVSELLSMQSWDLFTAAFSECHCVGHQFWPVDPADTHEAVIAVYSEIDRALAAIAALGGRDCTVMVYCSHGMSPADHGTRLVAPVLERMGLAHVRNRRRRWLGSILPEAAKRCARRVLDRETIQRSGFGVDWPLDDPETIAIPLPNSRHGAIRLSLAGRDPGGTIEAGSAGQRRVIEDIRAGFSALRDVATGDPVVEDVIVIDEVLGDHRHPDLPDLVVRFRRDLGVIGDCRSDALGTIRVPLGTQRKGEHGTPGAIWAFGSGIEAGTDLGDVRTIDLAPTVIAALGLPLPDWIDGTPLAVPLGRG
ncbi:MAG: alkaline phosphatase family protein, partial [Acidobacteriota bacterium]|nr:alkaline phosphatase family protein [Acidobacteriota bacterium]